jgi:hypothetical protein
MADYTNFGKFLKPGDREGLLEFFLQPRFEELARAISGYSSYSLAGLSGNVTLPVDNARSRVVVLTGTPSGAVTLKIDDSAGANVDIIVVNNCAGASGDVTVKLLSGGTGVLVPAGFGQQLRHDGTNVYAVGEPYKPVTSTQSAPQIIAARVYHNAAQSIANATNTILAFNSERWDVGSCHDTVTNNSRLTAPAAGLYVMGANIAWDFSAAGTMRALHLKLNATTYIATDYAGPISATFGNNQNIACLYFLAKGDYVEVDVYQNSGGALNVAQNGNFTPEAFFARIG